MWRHFKLKQDNCAEYILCTHMGDSAAKWVGAHHRAEVYASLKRTAWWMPSWAQLLNPELCLKQTSSVLCSRCRSSSLHCFPLRASSWWPFPFILIHSALALALSLPWLGSLHTISLLFGTRNPTGLEEHQVRLSRILWQTMWWKTQRYVSICLGLYLYR